MNNNTIQQGSRPTFDVNTPSARRRALYTPVTDAKFSEAHKLVKLAANCNRSDFEALLKQHNIQRSFSHQQAQAFVDNSAAMLGLQNLVKAIPQEDKARLTRKMVQNDLQNIGKQPRTVAVDSSIIGKTHLFANTFSQNFPLKQLKDDQLQLAKGFSPKITLIKEEGSIKEEKLSDIQEAHIDTILIMGNNDLLHVQHVAFLYKKLNNTNIKIYISGFGGHGTSPGVIFSQTEAQTMKMYLTSLGIPLDVIILETQATNSGENVLFLSQYLNHSEIKARNILISGTPAALYRQIRTFEKQATYRDWHTLSINGPVKFEGYYQNEQDGMISMMCALREVASFLDYTVNTNYMSQHDIPHKEEMTQAILTFVRYYNSLTNKDIDGQQLVKDFFAICKAKEAGQDFSELKKTINESIKPMAEYFRHTFGMIETTFMRRLPQEITQEVHDMAIREQMSPKNFRNNTLFTSPKPSKK